MRHMEKTRHVSLVGRMWRLSCNSTTTPGWWKLVTTKASSRAAVHGVKKPVPDTLDKEEVEKEIQKAKEEKEAKRRQIEETVEPHISNSSKSDSSSANSN